MMKKGCFKTAIITGSVVLTGAIMIWLGLNLRGGASRGLRIGPQTTYVESVDPKSGLVDYASYLNEKLSAGVTGDNNAVEKLLHLTPHFDAARYPDSWWNLLAIRPEDLPSAQPFENSDTVMQLMITEFRKRQDVQGFNREVKVSALQERLFHCYSNPWSEAEFPELSTWIQNQNSTLDRIVKASELERFYFPVMATEQTGLRGNVFPLSQEIRNFSLGLALRSMNRLHRQDIAGCQRDLLSIRRLSHLVGQGPWLIEELISSGVGMTARKGELAMAESGLATIEELSDYFNKLVALPGRQDLVQRICVYERLILLDQICRIAVVGAENVELHPLIVNRYGPEWVEDMAISMVDWNLVLFEVNVFFDQLEILIEEKDFRKQNAGIQSLLRDVVAKLKNKRKPYRIAMAILGGRTSKAKLASAQVIGDFAFMLPNIINSYQYDLTQEKLLRGHFALEIFKATHGHYPADLQQIPSVKESKLDDPFSDQIFRYQLEQNPRIYSVGPNSVDDHGQTRFDQLIGDDITVGGIH